LQPILERLIKKADGDPVKLGKFLSGLKRNSYQTMPSPDKDGGVELAKYMQFLTKTQGAKVAAERLADYMQQNGINTAKSSLVP